MLVYTGIKNDFMNDVELDVITSKILEKYKQFFGNTSKSEINSWKNSMEYMYKVLNDKDIPGNSGVAIEFNIPGTSKRVDFILSGYDYKKDDSVIIVELKQWETCEAVYNKDGIVKTYVGGGIREVTHPSYQAMSYANLIKDFNLVVQEENINVYPCAYLHNYLLTEDDPINSDLYQEFIQDAPLFGNGDVLKLREFVKKYIEYGDDKVLLYKIENGKIRPSKRLQDTLSNMLQGNKEFLMIDEQKVIYEEAINMAISATADETQKQVLIVEGGPGTGKTVLAINLLVELTNRSMVCNYITKNAAPRDVFYNKLKGNFKQNYIKNIFKGSGSYIESNKNDFDCLIVDEAHRLNRKSGMYANLGENQIKEIINASKSSVFFIDENQRVTLKDIGSREEIIKQANSLGVGYKIVELESQFRCNGSDGYLSWLDNTLQIKSTANVFFDHEYDYDFKVFDNPHDLQQAIEEKNQINNKSRVVAGYCWEWPTGSRNDSNYHDIKIDKFNYGISWNLNGGELFAIGEETVKQAGCIHTTQGLEFDYVGVIIGEDLTVEDEKLITREDKRAKSDQSLKGIKKLAEEDPEEAKKIADQIIKNTYRTLMTRGMKGCYIYCVDEQLNEYFKTKLQGVL